MVARLDAGKTTSRISLALPGKLSDIVCVLRSSFIRMTVYEPSRRHRKQRERVLDKFLQLPHRRCFLYQLQNPLSPRFNAAKVPHCVITPSKPVLSRVGICYYNGLLRVFHTGSLCFGEISHGPPDVSKIMFQYIQALASMILKSVNIIKAHWVASWKS